LNLQDSNKRKMAQWAEGKAAPATMAELQTTELKRWPDFHFLIGCAEPGGPSQTMNNNQTTLAGVHMPVQTGIPLLCAVTSIPPQASSHALCSACGPAWLSP